MRNLSRFFCDIFTESVCEFYLPRELEIAIQFIGSLPFPVSFFSHGSSESFTSVRCFENLDVLRCQNNAIPRCVIYIRVYPWVTHPRMHIKVGGFAKVCMLFFPWGRFSSTRTRDSVFMATLNGNRCFTREPATWWARDTRRRLNRYAYFAFI